MYGSPCVFSLLISQTCINCGLDCVQCVKVLVCWSSPVRKLATTKQPVKAPHTRAVQKTTALRAEFHGKYSTPLRLVLYLPLDLTPRGECINNGLDSFSF